MTPDRASAWATGVGIGLAVFVVIWTSFNRLAGLLMPTPEGPISALSIAVLAGVFVALERGRVLSHRADGDTEQGRDETHV
ncbi:MAG TPA: hypothetical protein VF148_15030 [Acidimicrobiia bacterium]